MGISIKRMIIKDGKAIMDAMIDSSFLKMTYVSNNLLLPCIIDARAGITSISLEEDEWAYSVPCLSDKSK